MSYADVAGAARAAHLDIFGAFHPRPDDGTPAGTQTLVLLGPYEPGFWAHVSGSAEFADGGPDPLDRWSERVIRGLAQEIGARPLFPFGGPPYRPFIAWALRSGRAWTSPATLLVHDRAGLMVSYRGALALRQRLKLPALPAKPCDTCAGRPCLTACPVSALGPEGYDLNACHGFLDTGPGRGCMDRGCAARRACPISRDHGRLEPQSAFHMRAFHR